MTDHGSSIRNALEAAGAVRLRSIDLGRGLALAEWRNSDSLAHYNQPGHHTLSLYLGGGEGVLRVDGQVSGGGPNKVCVLPAGHESRWRISGALRMFHLYIDPAFLALQAAARSGSLRPVDLMDRTFADDPSTTTIVRDGILPLDWAEGSSRMTLSAACASLVHRLIGDYQCFEPTVARGGLSPQCRRRVIDCVESQLHTALTLDELASEAGLSTFHFAKMFRATFGLAPHRYVTERRIAMAKTLLCDRSQMLSAVAERCGFSSQSHFTRAFKQITGVTPGAWRSSTEGERLPSGIAGGCA